MKLFLLLFFLICSTSFPIAFADFSPGFDRKKASSNVEIYICSNETLAHLDLLMSTLYKHVLHSKGFQDSELQAAEK